MSAKKIYDLAVKTGTYQKNGETKRKYSNVGCVMQKDDNGRFLMIDPHFNFGAVKREESHDMVIVSMFDPKVKEETKSTGWSEEE